MINVEYKSYETEKTATGLFQWDYGQIIHIKGVQNVNEVHFARGDTALSVIPDMFDDGIMTRIPDVLLRESGYIIAYIYLTDDQSGKTVKILKLPVTKRARPEDYGGDEDGYSIFKVLTKQINTKSDDMMLDDGYLQLLSGGVPIGNRIRIKSVQKEVELRNDGNAVQWRYTDSNDWIDLISIEELRGPQGPAGKTPRMEMRNDHLYAIYE